MAFIKRSTVKPVNAKIGRHMPKCPKCGKVFVSQFENMKFASACLSCSSKTDNFEESDNFESDLDQE